MTLEQALASEFFRWFHLEPAGDRGDLRAFRPQAPKFRPLAEVRLTVEGKQIFAMELVLSRSFIADPQDSASARDLARSFLQFACAGAGAAPPQTVLDEIQFRGLRRPILMRGAPPDIPSESSAVYRAFIGQIPHADLVVGTTAITLSQSSASGGELIIAARPA